MVLYKEREAAINTKSRVERERYQTLSLLAARSSIFNHALNFQSTANLREMAVSTDFKLLTLAQAVRRIIAGY